MGTHPVGGAHPETGRKLLFVNHSYTIRFDGMTEAESAPLLGFLLEQGHRPEFTCRFRWANGSVAFWDNRCVKHLAVHDAGPFRRVMRRVQLAGESGLNRVIVAPGDIWGSGTPLPPHRRRGLLEGRAARGWTRRAFDDRRVHPPEGSRLRTARPRGGPPAPGPAGDPRQVPPGSPGEPRPHRGLEASAGDARVTVRLPAAAPEDLADGRHPGLAVARRRARRGAPRAARGGLPAAGRAGGRAPPGAQADHRSSGPPAPHEGRGGLGEFVGAPGAREASERGGQGDGGAQLLERALSLPQHPFAPPPLTSLRMQRLFWGTDITRIPCTRGSA